MKVICFLEGFEGKIYPGYPEYASAWLKDYDYFAKRPGAKYYLLDINVTDEILYKALLQLTEAEMKQLYHHEKGLTAQQIMLELQTKQLQDYPSGRSVKVKPREIRKDGFIRV